MKRKGDGEKEKAKGMTAGDALEREEGREGQTEMIKDIYARGGGGEGKEQLRQKRKKMNSNDSILCQSRFQKDHILGLVISALMTVRRRQPNP